MPCRKVSLLRFAGSLFILLAGPSQIESALAADEAAVSSGAAEVVLAPKVGTVFPIYLGGGIELTLQSHFQLDLEFGLTPKAYSSAIGSAAVSFGGNSSYKDVVEAAYQNNSLVRFGARYGFQKPMTGWKVGVLGTRLTSSGRAAIDQVLAAATGNSYTNLKTLLLAAGRSTDVDMSATLIIGEIEGSYGWELGHGFYGNASVGIAKVLDSTVALKTGLSNFEATAAGNNLMRTSESDLRSILIEYGISPTLGFTVSYGL
jgi:hypothetical protein